jgi:hypothetical protein
MASKFLRWLKKDEKRYRDKLIEQYGYTMADFHPSDGTDQMKAPEGTPKHLVSDNYAKGYLTRLLPGTPLFVDYSYWAQEADLKFPSDVYLAIERHARMYIKNMREEAEMNKRELEALCAPEEEE